MSQRQIDCFPVALHHLGTTLAIGLVDRVFDLRDRLCARQRARDRKEARLHDGIDASAHARLACHDRGIDGVEADVLVDDLLLHLAGQPLPDPVGASGRVQQEHGTVGRMFEHIDPVEELELVTRHEAGLLYQVRGSNRARARAQMGDRRRPRLLRIVDEVALYVQIRLGANNLDGVLVSADGAISTEAIEERCGDIRRLAVERLIVRQRSLGHIVHDTDRKVVLRTRLREVVENRLHHSRRELFGRQAVATAHDARLGRKGRASLRAGLRECSDHILIKRVAERTGFFGAVHDRDRANRLGKDVQERGDRKWPKQAHLQHSDLLAASREKLHSLVRSLGARPHNHEHSFGVGMADVLEQAVPSACARSESRHHLLNDRRAGAIE